MAILSENRLEWVVADYAILAVRAVTVALHALLSPALVTELLQDSAPRLVFVSTREQRDKVRRFQSEATGLSSITCFEEEAAHESGWNTLAALEALGKARLTEDPDCVFRRLSAVQPDDLAAILYTSGTTEEPKGVMLTYRNFVFMVQARAQYVRVPEIERPVALSCLPLSHVYARTCDLYAALEAGRILALGESIETLARDLQETRPHFLSGVPRLYEKLASLARSGWEAGDREVLRRLMGGRIGYCSCGGAALAPEVAAFYAEAGVPVYQGYGLTETSPTISVNFEGRNKPGTVGVPIPGIEVKIAADGEIWTRGPHIMKGYWKKARATAEALDTDGWLHTGDLGRLDEEGFLQIIGRKKDLIVTAYGKNIAPQPIETGLCFDPYIEQAYVYGDNKPFLTALIVPSETALQEWARQNGLGEKCHAELISLHEIHTLFQERIAQALSAFAPYEQIRRFVLLPSPFSADSAEITLTAKLRRHQIGEHYREALEGFYIFS